MTTISALWTGFLDGTIPQEKEEHYLKIVSDEAKRLARLTKTLLDLTKIQEGKMRLSKTAFDICELAGLALISFEQRIRKKRSSSPSSSSPTSSRSSPITIPFTRRYTTSSTNAVKFCSEGGSITIRISEEKDKQVKISIKNTGMGISKKDLPMIFDRFYKTDKSRSEDKKGSGLGLYIVKAVLLAHNKEIFVKSAEGEYSEFYFSLDKAE
jgi:signal transduction histidine kinase